MNLRKTGGSQLAYVKGTLWANPAAGVDVSDYSDVEIQIVGLTAPLTPMRSIDRIAFDACKASRNGVSADTITADGIWRLPGRGDLKLQAATMPTRVFIRTAI